MTRSPFRFRAPLALAALLASAPLATPAGAATTYSVDKNHTDVTFQIRHIVSQVRGVFRDVSGTIVKDDANPAASSVEFTIQATSVDTGVEMRDNDLRGENFFDVAKYPTITFKSKRIEKSGANSYKVTGDFTMRGVTQVMTLDVSFDGEEKDAKGGARAGFSTATVIDRKAFGIVWNKTLDSGGTLLSDEVKVSISIEARTN